MNVHPPRKIGLVATLIGGLVLAAQSFASAAEPAFVKAGRKALGDVERALLSSWGKLAPDDSASLATPNLHRGGRAKGVETGRRSSRRCAVQ